MGSPGQLVRTSAIFCPASSPRQLSGACGKTRTPSSASMSAANVRPEKSGNSDEQTRQLLAAQPYDVRVACSVCLFCTLRVSEVFGLQEKHLDFGSNTILVRQRYYRGAWTKPRTTIRVVMCRWDIWRPT